jgi:hypothetical protein
MAKPANRSQLSSYFGAKQRNAVWGWCAANDSEKKAYFSIWTDFYRISPDETEPC